jgi:hypothetical protein
MLARGDVLIPDRDYLKLQYKQAQIIVDDLVGFNP